MIINILGTEYEIFIKKYDEDPSFERNSFCAYCSSTLKQIVVCDLSTYPGMEDESQKSKENYQNLTLRHEIIHAFLNESGLDNNAASSYGPWSKNEEMVDWFAIQGPKIVKAWQDVGAMP